MKRIILISSVLLLFFTGKAQVQNDIPEYYSGKDSLNKGTTNDVGGKTGLQLTKPAVRTSIEAGTSVGSFSGYGTGFNTYISPIMSYDLSGRFSLDVGFTYSQGNLMKFYSPYYGEQLFPLAGNMNQKLVFTRGRYLVNDRLTLFGSAMYGITTVSPSSGTSQNYTAKAFSFGAEYKISDHSYIGIEIRQSSPGIPFQSVENQPFPMRSSVNH